MKQLHRYSQKFISDKGIIRKILLSLDASDAIIVEVGSGDGRLSDHLRAVCRKLICVEIDRRFCRYLEKRFGHDKKVTVVNSDILQWPLTSAVSDGSLSGVAKVVLVGNIPYHISKRFVRYCIANRAFIQRGYFMFQREFADKLLAKVSTASYCWLSCFFQYYATGQRLFDVPADAFSPPPRVASSFVKTIFFTEPRLKAVNDAFLFQIINAAFSQRRKKIINSLACYSDIVSISSKLKIDLNARAENISLATYIKLANELYSD